MPSKLRLSSLGTSSAVHILLIVLCTALVFSNTLENDFHLDSIYRIKNNYQIDTLWPPTRFFTDPRTGSSIPQIAEYRPMMPLSHAINSEIAEFTGTSRLKGFHVGNIAIHISSSIVVYLLFCNLLANWSGSGRSMTQQSEYKQIAFVAALVFAVHPISGSAVNYLAARDLLLMVFFIMSSFYVYIRMRQKGDSPIGWLLSLLLLSLAILSKQSAIMGFGLIFIFEWIVAKTSLKDWRLWGRTFLYGVPTMAFFLVRWIAKSGGDSVQGLRTPQDWSYPITMLDAHVFYYLRNFIWPFEMRALAQIEILNSIFAPTALIGLLFILGSLFVAWWARKRLPLISFSILAYWLFLSLTSSIFPFQYEVTDYRQYLSSAFLCLLVSMALFKLIKKPIVYWLAASMVLYFSVSSYAMNKHWKTEESFWKQSVTYGADALAHHNYAMSVAGKNPELAELHFHKALEQYPYHIYANISLAMLEIRQNKIEDGLKRLRLMATLNPNWALSHYWLAMGLESAGQKEQAIEHAIRAAELDPRSVEYLHKAATTLRSSGKRSQSIPYYERLVALAPDYQNAEFWLAFMYQKKGQSQQSIEAYKRFISRHPDYVQAHFNLAYELKNNDDCTSAISHFKRVLELRPSYKEAEQYLTQCYQSVGKDNSKN